MMMMMMMIYMKCVIAFNASSCWFLKDLVRLKQTH